VVTNVDKDSPTARSLEEDAVIINRLDVNSVADFDKLAAEAPGRVLLRIIRHGEAAFVVTSSGENDEQ